MAQQVDFDFVKTCLDTNVGPCVKHDFIEGLFITC